MVEKACWMQLTLLDLLQTLIVRDPKQKGQEYQVRLNRSFSVGERQLKNHCQGDTIVTAALSLAQSWTLLLTAVHL